MATDVQVTIPAEYLEHVRTAIIAKEGRGA